MTAEPVSLPAVTEEDRNHRTKRRIDGQLVYAVGDIHGRYDLLLILLEQIARDARRHEVVGRRPLLIFCGDYVDRGPDSAKVLSTIAWMRAGTAFETRCLKGNHEQMMLTYIEQPPAAAGWLRVGGAETLASYGITAPAWDAVPEEHYRARDQLLDAMSARHLRLLQTLETLLLIGDYAFAHAGVRPGVSLHRQLERDLLWIRDDFLNARRGFKKMIVHGHSWDSDEPFFGANRIGVDTGAYRTGVLTAARIMDGEIGYLQAHGPEGPESYEAGHGDH